MRFWLSLGCGLILTTCFAACGGGEEGEELPEVDCAAAPVPGFGDVSAFTKCISCHDSAKMGADREAAPPDVNFDTYDAAKAHAKKAAEEVFEGKMPPPDSDVEPLSQAQKDQLYRWALCGTPEMSSGGTMDAGGTGGSGNDAAAPGDGAAP